MSNLLVNRIPFPIPIEDRKQLVAVGEKLRDIRRKSESADLGKDYKANMEILNTLIDKLRFKYGV